MIVNYREKMREYLKEPNEICNHYGKWGILNKEQRDLITRLLNEMDEADNYIKVTKLTTLNGCFFVFLTVFFVYGIIYVGKSIEYKYLKYGYNH